MFGLLCWNDISTLMYSRIGAFQAWWDYAPSYWRLRTEFRSNDQHYDTGFHQPKFENITDPWSFIYQATKTSN